MEAQSLAIADVKLLTPRRFDDPRGYFMEVYNRDALTAAGLRVGFVQDNQSLSCSPGTIRGLHFQRPPFAQAKLVRVLRGAIVDVAVDLRQGSPTYGRHVTAELSATNMQQLFVPAGFAHGFCTLAPDTIVLYKVSAPYSREHDDGVRWDDPRLAIDWPVSAVDAILSEKDSRLPFLDDQPPIFQFAATAGNGVGTVSTHA